MGKDGERRERREGKSGRERMTDGMGERMGKGRETEAGKRMGEGSRARPAKPMSYLNTLMNTMKGRTSPETYIYS